MGFTTNWYVFVGRECTASEIKEIKEIYQYSKDEWANLADNVSFQNIKHKSDKIIDGYPVFRLYEDEDKWYVCQHYIATLYYTCDLPNAIDITTLKPYNDNYKLMILEESL